MSNPQFRDKNGASSVSDSWVDLYNLSHNSNNSEPPPELTAQSITNNIEKLLIEAQKESRTPSRHSSSRDSPKSPNSPSSEWAHDFRATQPDPGTDWIWDWSSRPELAPPGDLSSKFKHPASKPRSTRLSMRRTRVMKNGVFSLENLPTLLVSHACTFFLGAAVVLIYMKKYYGWLAVSSVSD